MATINTRLKLKYDSYENWMEHDPVLLAGEVAFATVSVKQDGTVNEVPSVLMKVGDGEKKYSELDFTYAKAADVLAACKTEAGLRTFINGVIADAGIASSEAMEALAGRVTTAEGQITALDTKIGDDTVANQIKAAIAELKLDETYEAKGEAAKVQTALDTYKTSNDKAVAENKAAIEAEAAAARAAEKANADAIAAINNGTTIDSFADVETALAGKEAAGEAAKAQAAAEAYADSLATNYDAAGSAAAVQGKLDEEIERAKAAEAQALTDAKAHTNTEISRLVGDTPVETQISTAIANKSDKGHVHTKSEITDFAHTHEMSEVNGLEAALEGKQAVGDYATKAEAQGYADAKDEAIEAAQAAADKAQEDVDALGDVVGELPTGETSVIAYIEKKTTGIATDAALGELQTAVNTLSDLVGDEPVEDQIADAVKEEADRAKEAEGGLATRVKAIEDDYLVAADKTELTGAIATAKQEAIEAILGGAVDEDFDTLKEVAAWIASDTTASAQLVTRVTNIENDYLKGADKTALQNEIAALEEFIGELPEGAASETVVAYIQEVVDGLKIGDYAKVADLNALTTRVKANEDAIAVLQAQMGGDDSVEDQITAAINALNIDQYATDSDVEALTDEVEEVEGRVTDLENELNTATTGLKARMTAAEGEIAKKANSADLATVATTGDIADLTQATGEYIIFDCGSASVNI